MSTFVDAQEYVVINCGAEEHGGAFMFAVTREFHTWTLQLQIGQRLVEAIAPNLARLADHLARNLR